MLTTLTCHEKGAKASGCHRSRVKFSDFHWLQDMVLSGHSMDFIFHWFFSSVKSIRNQTFLEFLQDPEDYAILIKIQ